MKTKQGKGNYIFVGSNIDLFAKEIRDEWAARAIDICNMCDENTYLFQSKNPGAFKDYIFPKNTILCTTIETNRYYAEIMGNCKHPGVRVEDFSGVKNYKKMVTIEPILDFDMDSLIFDMVLINPIQINIGADSGNNNLPEPSREKLLEFIAALKEKAFNVHLKDNLKRIIG